MSWLRNTSLSFARQISRSLDPRHDYEAQACYNSFCKHWQQAYEIILKSQPRHLHDDVLGVVNHLEQLTSLLILEAKARELNIDCNNAECLEYLLSENLLDKLYEWAVCTGKYENAVRLEELKLFGSLISYYSSQIIAAEPFLRPLLKLLSGFRNELPPPNVENQLVAVLNQLCVALMQNTRFIDLFFLTTHTQNGSINEFIIVRLLLPSVHREGAVGASARDSLLLCADMSRRCQELADYILEGNTCPVLATGLSGLYSLLPRILDEKINRLTPDDVNQVHKLTIFIDSLEFCNAVAQVSHPSIKKHLLDLLYQGFLVPVMGPALLQSGIAEQTAAMAYLEQILRCVTSKGLLRAVLHFMLIYDYDGVKVIDVLLKRMEGNTQQSLVSLCLMETLVDLNCEDAMVELVYKYLLNGHHLMLPYRNGISDPDNYRDAALSFLTLSPLCCTRSLEKTKIWVDDLAINGRRLLEFKREDNNRRLNGTHDNIPMNSFVQETKLNYGNPNETLINNYHAYLCDARLEIVWRSLACTYWSSKYDRVILPKSETNNNSAKDVKELEACSSNTKEQDSITSVCTSGYETLKTSDTSEKEPHSFTSLTEACTDSKNLICDNQINDSKELDSLTSIGENSGFDSFKYRVDNVEDEGEKFSEELFKTSLKPEGKDTRIYGEEMPLAKNWKASAESIIGPLLSTLLKKASILLESDVTSNCRVTGVLTKLASLPTPLISSLLLCQGFGLQPNVPSLFQILNKLKEELDELTSNVENVPELVDKARVFLIQRELAFVKSRGAVNDEAQATPPASSVPNRSLETTPRVESKRRSLSTSLSNFARRISSATSPLPPPALMLQNAPMSSPQKRLLFTQESYWDQSITLRSILNAVILDEWIKELASLCEEHALRLSTQNYEDDAYIRTVAL